MRGRKQKLLRMRALFIHFSHSFVTWGRHISPANFFLPFLFPFPLPLAVPSLPAYDFQPSFFLHMSDFSCYAAYSLPCNQRASRAYISSIPFRPRAYFRASVTFWTSGAAHSFFGVLTRPQKVSGAVYSILDTTLIPYPPPALVSSPYSSRRSISRFSVKLAWPALFHHQSRVRNSGLESRVISDLLFSFLRYVKLGYSF